MAESRSHLHSDRSKWPHFHSMAEMARGEIVVQPSTTERKMLKVHCSMLDLRRKMTRGAASRQTTAPKTQPATAIVAIVEFALQTSSTTPLDPNVASLR